MIETPVDYNFYLNPQYYSDVVEANNHPLQEWLDRPLHDIDSQNVSIQFPLTNGYYYLYQPTIPLETYRDLLVVCYQFYFQTEIDADYVSNNNLPIETGYWFFYLDYSGCQLAGFEVVGRNRIVVHTKSAVKQTLHTPTQTLTKPYLCKNCYTLHNTDCAKCEHCKRPLTAGNRKY